MLYDLVGTASLPHCVVSLFRHRSGHFITQQVAVTSPRAAKRSSRGPSSTGSRTTDSPPGDRLDRHQPSEHSSLGSARECFGWLAWLDRLLFDAPGSPPVVSLG